jgi:hypothetical protein
MTDIKEKTEITLLIDRATDQYLARMASQLGRDRNEIANEALIEWLEDLEDIAEAERVLAEGNPTIPAEEMWKRLGLED